MDLSYSDEQKQIKEGVERFVREQYAFETRRKIAASEKGWLPENWAKFAELGWLGMSFSEADGGFGGGAIETMIAMEAFGSGLVLEPYLPTVVMGGGLLAAGGSAAQKEALLAPMIAGEKQFAVAYVEKQARFNLADVAVTAKKDGAGFAISGHKGVVYNAASADTIFVTARTSGGQRDEKGITVFAVDAKAQGISRRDYPTQDALRASELTFDNVKVGADAVVGKLDDGYALFEGVVDRSIVALCAEAVGCMDAINKATLEYIKTRKQFGVPIGKFQVLQHRMVDCFTNAQEARSMTLMAALKIDDADATVRKKAASGAKVQIGKSGRFCGQSAVQMHGGMGVTDELSVSHYFKRLTMIETLFGNQQHHLTRYANLSVAA
ncbi:MAG: acyl-CoA dehydrogenase family protein [Alphaproteobacteria bacterium]|nr:acyl-CoA dehydrogenase family protein [Alphaproteobacteria bacterium]MCW5738548.1 acyl-CoA dehydrogenase family protein [Alphaproteobacteria bacterium]